MSRYNDLTGKRFGKLVVLQKSEQRLSNKLCWECICDCGNTTIVRGECLSSGHTKSCGCGHGVRIQIGDRFGQLEILENLGYASSSKRTNLWKCQCDCGNIINYTTQDLREYKKISCGCVQKPKQEPKSKAKNLIGQRFNKLVVESQYSKDKTGHVRWLCRCDCGNTCVRRADHLKTNIPHSCGCQTASFGEFKIIELLESNNIPYKKEKTFDDCRFPSTNYMAKFDFYVNDKYLIEFDGIQHFSFSGTSWDTKEQFEITKARDTYKNQWCLKNNIPLIRIPYTHLSKLSLEDILLETSQFLVKPE